MVIDVKWFIIVVVSSRVEDLLSFEVEFIVCWIDVRGVIFVVNFVVDFVGIYVCRDLYCWYVGV